MISTNFPTKNRFQNTILSTELLLEVNTLMIFMQLNIYL